MEKHHIMHNFMRGINAGIIHFKGRVFKLSRKKVSIGNQEELNKVIFILWTQTNILSYLNTEPALKTICP